MNAIDLFAGAGGWSHGWTEATGHEPMVAVNHCAHAVRLHTLNHPSTEHWCESVQDVSPHAAVRGRRVDWLHLSPDCTHFSRAKGGKPRKQEIRGLAWLGVDWAEAVRPAVLSLENVAEFEGWGPLDADGQPIKARAGETFQEFVAELRDLGYQVEWRVLSAADYGAPTIRRRLYLIARCDGRPIRWPEPTHGPGRAKPWRTAAECIDWTLPCPSIFTRKKPLAEATLKRIAAGVVRFVLKGQPFIVTCNHSGDGFRGQGLDEPMKTITASRDAHGLVAAFLARHYTGMVGEDLRKPLPTVTAIDHHSLVTATLGGAQANPVAAFITTYYQQGGTANRVDQPLPAVVTKARHGLVTIEINGNSYAITDIGMRMLAPRELARAQGFPDSYVLEGTKAQQIARIGNSVCPQVAEAIVRANKEQGA